MLSNCRSFASEFSRRCLTSSIFCNNDNNQQVYLFVQNRCVHQASKMSETTHLTNKMVRMKRMNMFDAEKKRQMNLVSRIEKIAVQYEGQPEDALLYMNKNLSTPYNVCQHLGEMLIDRSALALVNGQLWDMNRPLVEDCTLKLLHFHCDEPFHVNKAFWRSCSFMLSAAVERAFKDDIYVELHSFPAPNVASGSFVCDVDLKLGHDWTPTKQEMMVFSSIMHKLAEENLPFERLVVDPKLAAEMFKDNKYKSAQIPNIAENYENKITLYKIGDHVDISGGPMVGSTKFLGRRCTVPVAHKISHNNVSMYRFQGVALPKDMYLNHVAFHILEERAAQLNPAGLHTTQPVNLS
ncbi:39S ribosomal protein L39, mitochondrial [Eurytemora carolleeae]|uniref:39S ribosomal protein L39, mitochondrial n=1 Tax=Eurytemora carolleeae TaxID=1294199 RepID=UPI000C78060D|nr:39S ribosomal protein L39, mitochondrial [Eurytemora carolleeae]|eukprot:XP_023323548.1 39S ribosomal protein L39, mitochondrial-like [Eurytemora affinis]